MGSIQTSVNQDCGEEFRSRVLEHLEQMLASSEFSASRRCQEFLRYVVSETLENRGEGIKERNIAVSVFGKTDDYDPSENSLVRVKAVEVRKRLARYYESAGPCGIRIELSPGSYVPRLIDQQPLPPVQQTPESVTSPGKPGKHWRIGFGAAALFALAVISWWVYGRTRLNDLDRLWAPLLSAGTPVLISLPSPDVYEFWGRGRPDPDLHLQGRDLKLMRDYYTGKGAAFAAVEMAELFTSRGTPFALKFGQDVTFSELRDRPAILLGLNSSFWTMEMSKDLTFVPVREGDLVGFEDRRDHTRWTYLSSRVSSEDIHEDYAMAARIIDSRTGQRLMIAAGLTARGTQVAAEFLTKQHYFEMFVKKAPRDWAGRNFQVVLHAEVHGSTPGPPQLVRFQVW